jgi:valyl-tRNA synthetase
VFIISAKVAVFLEVKGCIDIESEIRKAQTKIKKAADAAIKLKNIIEAPDFGDKSSEAVQEMERKRLANLLAEQSNYERSIEQFRRLKLEEN